jgi:hypothetical protein
MAKREVIDLQREADEARSGVAKSEAARRHLERFKQGEIDRWGATPASLRRWATSISSVHKAMVGALLPLVFVGSFALLVGMAVGL